ncbi:MAG: hypothetical protein SFT92_09550 [Rickettsiales bacterium]|nr:hypothetical protein [Rickettsiales bacterium]
MAEYDPTPQCDKACTNKCAASTASGIPVWVLAACEGAGMVFKRVAGEGLMPLHSPHGACSSQSMQDIASMLDQALSHQEYAQLIIVGSSVDIAWVHSALPTNIMRHIIAEMPYPLLASWFNTPTGRPKLMQALENAVGT